jgi:Pentapeptide repeats (8 copies)
LEGAQLQDADLEGAALQGAVLASADIWLVKFPAGLSDQSPAPFGFADVKMSALMADAKAQLKQNLNTDITDREVLTVVTARLDQILRNEPPNWEDGNSWQDYISKTREPTAEELARFHAALACDDTEGTIANSIAGRAAAFETEHFGKGYAKPFAHALLDETCKGGKALNRETRAALMTLASAPE